MKRILFLAANPKNVPGLQLDEEIRKIDEALQRSPCRQEFELVSRWAVRPKDIPQSLLQIEPQIVHFAGHGMSSGADISDLLRTVRSQIFPSLIQSIRMLVHQTTPSRDLKIKTDEGFIGVDEAGNPKTINTTPLAELFYLFTSHVECVVLNYCDSVPQAKAIAQHIPYTIGTKQPITDAAAIEFAGGFYTALGAGRSYEDAYEFGCNAIAIEGLFKQKLIPALYRKSDIVNSAPAASPIHAAAHPSIEFPNGPVPLDSAFYIECPQINSTCYQAISSPSSLLRITAPDRMGKTSLMFRVMNYAEQHGHTAVDLKLGVIDREMLSDRDRFFRGFCEVITEKLKLENHLDQYWRAEEIGYLQSCTRYLEQYVLPNVKGPFMLGLDEVDKIFPNPEISVEFFKMLRCWFEYGKQYTHWKPLRLVLAYSTEDYSQFNQNHSPFNVGQEVVLPELTQQQVDDLAQRHGLTWSNQEIKDLMDMVGGHPYLLRLAMYHAHRQSLKEILQNAPSEEGVFRDHLRHYSEILQSDPALLTVAKQVFASAHPIVLSETSLRYRLRSMGLIKRQDNPVEPSCNLYPLYFRVVLNQS
jgi:hypothetical protein